MEKTSKIVTFLSIMLFTAASTFAQNKQGQKPEDASDQQKQAHYKTMLNVDSEKAAEVSRIQDKYKADMQSLISDKNLTTDVRTEKMRLLIEGKNKKLAAILDPEQQSKIIPPNERNSKKDIKTN